MSSKESINPIDLYELQGKFIRSMEHLGYKCFRSTSNPQIADVITVKDGNAKMFVIRPLDYALAEDEKELYREFHEDTGFPIEVRFI